MPKQITSDQVRVYYQRRDAGFSMRASSLAAGFSLSYARTIESGERRAHGGLGQMSVTGEKMERKLPEPKRYDQLSAEAKAAHDDFATFQRRYFGRVPIPWQVEAAEFVVERIEYARKMQEKQFIVINAPPGSGKTILFTHDLPAWLTVRNRAIRGQLGSVTGPLAQRYTRRLRSSLERVLPEKADSDDLAAGTAFDALATLAGDFGRFKPLERDLWTIPEFIIMQHAGIGAISEKEPTWSAYGVDQGFIGGRYPFIVWDDLVDPSKQSTIEANETLQYKYDTLCETRLEPGGVLVLQGQRIDGGDLYRYNLDKIVPEIFDADSGEILQSRPKYWHLKFPAHYVDRCAPDNHRRLAPSYPDGCLLAPTRLSWMELQSIAANNRNRFEVVYQQEDTDPGSVLVQREWVNGNDGRHIGCIDLDRDRLEFPKGLAPPFVSYATADPSPSRFWGIEWWIYHPASEQRFLMDLINKPMDAPDLLDYSENLGDFVGVMEDWRKVSIGLGFPITHWIVEVNAAQKFLLQYDTTKRWVRKYGAQIIPHTTTNNKTDPEYGVQMLAPHWEFGRIRLPFKERSMGRVLSLRLINEVTHYPDTSIRSDLVMAQWFGEFNLPRIHAGPTAPKTSWRPGWVKDPRRLTNGTNRPQR